MNEIDKIKMLQDLEPIIEFNVRRLFNYRMNDFEDLMQEARMIIYNSLDKYNEDKGSLSTFCQILIKNNLVCLTISQYKNWDKVTVMGSDELPEIEDLKEDRIKEVYLRVHYMLEFYKNEFTKAELKFGKLLIEGKSFKEIESILGITTNHRVQLAYQFKRKAQQLLKKEEQIND